MFDVLNVKDNTQRSKIQYCGPESKVPNEDALEVLDLQCSLNGGSSNKCSENDLRKSVRLSWCFVQAAVTHQFGIEVPIFPDWLRCTFPEKEPYCTKTCNYTPSRNYSHPDVQETRSKVKASRTQRTPSFRIAACWLPESRSGCEIAAVITGEWLKQL